MPGFTARYEGRNETSGKDIRIAVFFERAGRVRMDVESQNFSTYFDGNDVILWDKGMSHALVMDLRNARTIVREAAGKLAPLADIVPEAGTLAAKADIHPFYLVDLSDGNANLAITFAARPCDAPWLNRLAETNSKVEEDGDTIAVAYDAYVHTIRTKDGVLSRVEHREEGRVARHIALKEFSPGTPPAGTFVQKLPAGVKRESAPPDLQAIDAVVRSQYKIFVEQATSAEASRWASLTADDKERISSALKAYWEAAFAHYGPLRDHLLEMVSSTESAQIIRGQLDDREAFARFKSQNNIVADGEANELWPRYIAARMANEVLAKAAEPIQDSVVKPLIAHIRKVARVNGLTEEQAEEMLQLHTAPMVTAMFESLMPPLKERFDRVVDEANKKKTGGTKKGGGAGK
ncbi:hypothetical protein K8I61_15705 [bacterium]|nr:hypothetical protein [bacterium]